MNSEQLRGRWNQIKGEVKQRWGRFTEAEIEKLDGDRDKFFGMIQER